MRKFQQVQEKDRVGKMKKMKVSPFYLTLEIQQEFQKSRAEKIKKGITNETIQEIFPELSNNSFQSKISY